MISALVHGILLASLTSWTMIAGGDMMLNGISAKQNPFAGIESVVRKADIAYANLEIPLTTARQGTSRKTRADIKARNQYILKAETRHGRHIASSGFDVVTLANNHAMDYRVAGLTEMTKILDQQKLTWTGAGMNREDANRLSVFTMKNGTRVGFLAYLAFVSDGGLGKCTPATDDQPGVATLALGGVVGPEAKARFKKLVQESKANCDVLFIALHWGIEKMTKPTAYQMKLGRAWIDAGATGILGAHPHVLQPVEMYKGRPILYSMGNLVSPRPAKTALYRLRFTGTKCTGVERLDAAISSGKVRLVAPKKKRKR